MARQPRLVFGEVADLYDRVRPSYPDALVDDVVELSGVDVSGRALEVGAGTAWSMAYGALFLAVGAVVKGVMPKCG